MIGLKARCVMTPMEANYREISRFGRCEDSGFVFDLTKNDLMDLFWSVYRDQLSGIPLQSPYFVIYLCEGVKLVVTDQCAQESKKNEHNRTLCQERSVILLELDLLIEFMTE